MALFVLGAGATRGASFVKASEDPCLPPLDGDFFTQLQRIRNPKHRTRVSEVMADVVELFGPNFDVTMETVFTTLEQTIAMLKTTGETRDFKIPDLKARKARLEQAVAAVLEDSLTVRDGERRSSFEPRPCTYHQRLVEAVAAGGDDFVSFNYDCLLDYSLKQKGAGKWNPQFGYGIRLGKGRALKGTDYWRPDGAAATRDRTIRLFKLHGSLHFVAKGPDDAPTGLRLKERPYARNYDRQKFTIIPPESNKPYNRGVFRRLWEGAAAAIHRAEHIVVIGYSLPPTDAHATALFRTSVRKERLKSVIVVNPDRAARRRIRSVLQRGFSKNTRVLSFDYLSEFVAMERSVWEFNDEARAPAPAPPPESTAEGTERRSRQLASVLT